MKVNVDTFINALSISQNLGSVLFCPSSISAYGFTDLDNRKNISEESMQKPLYLYGITKVYMEQLGSYWTINKGIDFRSIRYPGIVSSTLPHGGTTDFITRLFKSYALCCFKK